VIAAAPVAQPAAAHSTVLAGSLRGTAGRVAQGRARARVVLTSAAGHRFTARITTGACRGLHGCPAGTLRGTWAVIPTPSDAGETVAMSGRGTLGVLGSARAVGRGQGTGFIARGRPTLRLTLTTAAGVLTLTAAGPLEPGFTPLL
jgi:hypothetical protein